jgi:hypothetical protein
MALAAELGGLDPPADLRAAAEATIVRRVWSAFIRGQGGVTWSRPWALYALLRWAATHGIDAVDATKPDVAEAALQ